LFFLRVIYDKVIHISTSWLLFTQVTQVTQVTPALLWRPPAQLGAPQPETMVAYGPTICNGYFKWIKHD
jgi:hypothetical protein